MKGEVIITCVCGQQNLKCLTRYCIFCQYHLTMVHIHSHSSLPVYVHHKLRIYCIPFALTSCAQLISHFFACTFLWHSQSCFEIKIFPVSTPDISGLDLFPHIIGNFRNIDGFFFGMDHQIFIHRIFLAVNHIFDGIDQFKYAFLH